MDSISRIILFATIGFLIAMAFTTNLHVHEIKSKLTAIEQQMKAGQ